MYLLRSTDIAGKKSTMLSGLPVLCQESPARWTSLSLLKIETSDNTVSALSSVETQGSHTDVSQGCLGLESDPFFPPFLVLRWVVKLAMAQGCYRKIT